MIVAYLLLAAPVAAAVRFWGAWPWVAASVIVAVVEYGALQRSQQFSSRVWRSIGLGKRSTREQGAERIYVLTAVGGVALLAAALLGVG